MEEEPNPKTNMSQMNWRSASNGLFLNFSLVMILTWWVPTLPEG
jgi:hypothetical protein